MSKKFLVLGILAAIFAFAGCSNKSTSSPSGGPSGVSTKIKASKY